MPHVLPPYRADVVGSFLRPAAVAQARAAFARGEFSREALTAVEDEEIAALVKKELDNGLTAVTDGEFRRAFWHLDFLAGLKGIRHVKAEAWSVHFEGRQPKAETVVIEDRLSFPADHPFLEAFDRLKKIAGDAAVKYTIPSPSMLHLICCVRATDYEPIAAYKDNEELLLDDLAQTWTDAMLALYERGCRYLQLDDTSWGEFCSAEKRAAYAARGIDVDAVARSYVGVLNRIIAAKPADLTLTMHATSAPRGSPPAATNPSPRFSSRTAPSTASSSSTTATARADSSRCASSRTRRSSSASSPPSSPNSRTRRPSRPESPKQRSTFRSYSSVSLRSAASPRPRKATS